MLDTVIPVVVGGLLAMAGGMFAQLLKSQLEWKHARGAIAGAIAGEIGSICDIVRQLDYIGKAERFLIEVKNAGLCQRISLPMKRNYMQVFEGNTKEIGVLPAEYVHRIVCFYVHLNSLLENVHEDAPEPASTEEAQSLLESQIKRLSTNLALGEQIAKDLRTLAFR